jgi:hypothetical protein
MTKRYEWRDGRSQAVEASVVAARLDVLRKKHDRKVVEAKDFVKDAASDRSPLHPLFDWDDARCAQQHRESEARSYIRNIVVVEITNSKAKQALPAYVHIKTADRQGYAPLDEVLAEPDMAASIMQQLWRDLQALHSRYVTYAAEFGEVREIVEQLQSVLQRKAA